VQKSEFANKGEAESLARKGDDIFFFGRGWNLKKSCWHFSDNIADFQKHIVR